MGRFEVAQVVRCVMAPGPECGPPEPVLEGRCYIVRELADGGVMLLGHGDVVYPESNFEATEPIKVGDWVSVDGSGEGLVAGFSNDGKFLQLVGGSYPILACRCTPAPLKS